jgi:hypothetical protein
MYECESLFEENDEHTARNSVVIELVVVHVSLLCEYKGGVFEAYRNYKSEPKIGSQIVSIGLRGFESSNNEVIGERVRARTYLTRGGTSK